MQRLAASSRDPALIPILEGYAKANLGESDRKPVQQAIDRIRSESVQAARIRSETAACFSMTNSDFGRNRACKGEKI